MLGASGRLSLKNSRCHPATLSSFGRGPEKASVVQSHQLHPIQFDFAFPDGDGRLQLLLAWGSDSVLDLEEVRCNKVATLSSLKSQEMKHPVDTERLYFRFWTIEDGALAKALWGDERVTQLIDARGRLNDDQVTTKLQQQIDYAAKHGIQYWPIFLKQGQVHVGCAGLRPYEPDETILEVGFHLLYDYWGQGLAREAAFEVIRFAFEELGVRGLFAGHNPTNISSAHLLKKLGFHYTHDEFYPPTGLMHPSYLLLSAESPSD